MTDYPVNLPKTDFPMRANLAKREPEFLKFWQEIDLYRQTLAKRQGKDKFVLHDGPPYANGEIHLGHALNKILKDIIVKSKSMAGYLAPYIPGWDCHGLPIELQVEKKHGRKLRAQPEQLIAECRKYAASQIDSQSKDFQRLGVIGDWCDPYKTLNFKYEADILRAFAKIVENGYLLRGYKPVHWCTACGSALAEAEVEYQDKTSPAIDIRFRVVEAQKLGQDVQS
jgi:isoleucyl-tRNA synthetase